MKMYRQSVTEQITPVFLWMESMFGKMAQRFYRLHRHRSPGVDREVAGFLSTIFLQ
jgi:hypothetical protein